MKEINKNREHKIAVKATIGNNPQSKIWAAWPLWAILGESQETSSSKEQLWVLFPTEEESLVVHRAASNSKT